MLLFFDKIIQFGPDIAQLTHDLSSWI